MWVVVVVAPQAARPAHSAEYIANEIVARTLRAYHLTRTASPDASTRWSMSAAIV